MMFNIHFSGTFHPCLSPEFYIFFHASFLFSEVLSFSPRSLPVYFTVLNCLHFHLRYSLRRYLLFWGSYISSRESSPSLYPLQQIVELMWMLQRAESWNIKSTSLMKRYRQERKRERETNNHHHQWQVLIQLPTKANKCSI